MVISLLRSQNNCLKKLIQMSTEFLHHSPNSLIDRLESFDRSRSSAVRAFQLLDQKLTETVTSLNREDCGDSLRTHVAVILDEKKDLLEKLDHLSGKIIELISAAQRELEVELAASKKQKEVLGKFKSIPGSNSGKGLDRTL